MKTYKRILSIMLIIALSISIVACSNSGNEPAPADDSNGNGQASDVEQLGNVPEFVTKNYTLNMGTATSSGLFYAAGVALAQLWQEDISGYSASATSSSGSGENVTLLENNEANVCFIQSDVLLDSYNGKGDYEGAPHPQFRILSPMFANHYNLMVNKSSGVNGIKDVRGKRVVTGRPASGTLSATVAVLGSFDITLDDIVPNYLDQAQSVETLRNGLGDFAIAAGAIPMAIVTDAMTGNSNIRLIGLTQEEVDTVLAKNSWLMKMDIPANTYNNQPADLLTVGHNSYLVVREDMPEDVAYRLVMSMYENKDFLVQSLSSFNNPCFNIPSDSINQIGLPVHPGAQKAFKELGLLD
jgi:TRAP transporter TAXI family solute receptor